MHDQTSLRHTRPSNLGMPRLAIHAALTIAVLAPALMMAQTTPLTTYNSIRTPEIQLGSGTAPTIITEYPVVERSGASLPSETPVGNAAPSSTELLTTRHFDYIVSPTTGLSPTRGNLADTSISLGEYARQLRAQQQSEAPQAAPNAMPPGAIAQPADSR